MVFLLLCNFLQAQLFEVPLAERVTKSDLIIEGKVLSKYSFWDNKGHNIYTANRIEVYKVLKGSFSQDFVEIVTYGGKVDDRMDEVDHSLQLTSGETGIFTCQQINVSEIIPKEKSVERFFPYADAQGFLKYNEAEASANDYFKKYEDLPALFTQIENLSGAEPQIIKTYKPKAKSSPKIMAASFSGFSPSSISAGTGSVLTVSGSGFGASQGSQHIMFLDADNGGSSYIAPTSGQYDSWSDTEVQVQVPDNAGTGAIGFYDGSSITTTSISTLTIIYAHINSSSTNPPSRPDHVNDNGFGGYDFKFHTDYYNTSGAVAAYQRAIRTWVCDNNINFVATGTSIIDVISADGINIVRFDNGSELPSGVLGRMTSRWRSCNSSAVWWVYELDMSMNDGTTWYYDTGTPAGGQFDFESVTLHELGHGHQFGHVINNSDVMHYAISSGTTSRILSANNTAGAAYMMGLNTVANACGPIAMSTLTCPVATSAEFYADMTTVYTGQTITFEDVSFGTVTSRSWTFGDGGTSSIAQPTHSYSTAGQYTVTFAINGGGGDLTETKTSYILVLPLYTPPYTTAQGGDFESNSNDFGGDGVGYRWNIWERGSPSNVINAANSSSNVWKTDLDGSVEAYDLKSSLYTPAFDMSVSGTYTLGFYYRMDVTFGNAPFGVWVEYTTDNGSSWTRLGDYLDANGSNWYSTSTHSVVPDGHCWSHTRSSYTNATYDVSSLAGNAKVAFRISYLIELGWSGGYDQDGFAIDDFSLGATGLPITLADFSANKLEKEVLLEWETQSELNNEYFTIERSPDGIRYFELGNIAGAGNSTERLFYEYLDENPFTGKNYYRLKQTDFDGNFTYSDVRIVEFEGKEAVLNIFPNPVSFDAVAFQYWAPKENAISINIIDLSGKVILAQEGMAQQGMNYFDLKIEDLPKGVYFVKIMNEALELNTQSFIKN